MSDSRARAGLARAAARLKHATRSKLPALVLMTDDERLSDPLAAARALPRGSMVVVRARDPKRLKRLAQDLLKIARHRGFAVLIAGDPQLAARLGADGVHFAEVRAPLAAHCRARFPALAISCAAHSLGTVLKAQTLPVDAIFLSPVFVTGSHVDRTALSPMRANLIARASRKPVYALGGIDAQNSNRIGPGAFSGIAAISALSVGEN